MSRLSFKILLFSAVIQVASYAQQFPKWASDQLELRSIVLQSIRETQKWQRSDGTIYPNLNVYKWDDEVEIFYFWLPYYLLTGDESVYNSVRSNALAYVQRAVKQNLFEHGYFRDPFFDTEHTLEGMIALANLAWIRPDDKEVVNALQDVTEHAANLVEGYEPWFEPSTGLMRSVKLGTKKVIRNDNKATDWVFNLQFVKMALATFYAIGDVRYLHWSKSYLDGWIRVMENNYRENGVYLLPAEVDPYTGRIGHFSGVWYYAEWEPDWGWHIEGNSANRDMRGAFLDTYRLTGERRFLEAMIRHVRTLFDKSSFFQPANYYDGERWLVEDDKTTVQMSVQAGLLDKQIDQNFQAFMKRWYESQRYPEMEFHFWAYRKFGGEGRIDLINERSLDNARKRLSALKAMTQLPPYPDDFIKIGGHWGLTMPPFGGIASPRGEMPWLEVIYYRDGKKLGLPEGVAALFENLDEDGKRLKLCNTTDKHQTVWIQCGFPVRPIYAAQADGREIRVENGMACVLIEPRKTVVVRIETTLKDSEPPRPPTYVNIYANTR